MSTSRNIEITHKKCANAKCRISDGLQPSINFEGLTRENFDTPMQCKYCTKIDTNLKTMVSARCNLRNEIDAVTRRLYFLQRQYDSIDRNIMQTCPHQWIQDRTKDLCPYERYDYYCNNCSSVRITPGR